MNFYKKLVFSAIAGLSLMTTFVSCEDELDTIAGDVISGGEPFQLKKQFTMYLLITKKLSLYRLMVYHYIN